LSDSAPGDYDLSLVIPAFNEAKRIGRGLETVKAWVRQRDIEQNRGKGFSVRRGLLAGKGRIVGFCDADFSTPIEEADKLLAAINRDGYDIAIGSRAMKGSVLARRQPWYREYAGRAFSLYYRLVLIPGIVDSQCGFKFFRREAAHAIFAHQTVEGWAFDAEILFIARRLGYRIAQIPVRWVNGYTFWYCVRCCDAPAPCLGQAIK